MVSGAAGSGVFFLLLVTLAAAFKGGGHTGNLHDAATKARANAEIKKRKAAQTGHPADVADANAATKEAEGLTKAAALHSEAQKQPVPWPQKTPSGLPQFPAGWEPDEPPPQVVQNRAWQLLAPLWKRGVGATKTEKTAGRWITYQAQQMGKKKGVVAFRLRSEAALSTAA